MKKWRKFVAIAALLAFLGTFGACKAGDCGCPKFSIEQSTID